MTSDPAILFDVSRLISRLGGGPLTGIDRVELAWLRHLQAKPHLLLARVARGQLLLPPEAGQMILTWVAGQTDDLPQPGFLDRLRGHRDLPTRAARALRQIAILSAPRSMRGIADAVRTRLGEAVYLNLGHANWDRQVFGALQGFRRVVMIHDTIPLDHPEFTRKGRAEIFRTRFMVAAGMSDLILTVSQASAQAIELWRGRLAVHRRVPIVVAPLGLTPITPDPSAIPSGLDLSRPWFVTLGTIEPRKNHALLLDAWQELARDLPADRIPQLFIIGRRGWENEATFAWLDRLPKDGPVQELSGLSDSAVASLLARSRGLLMPSRAEGFGLPLIEAAAAGVPVVTAPLPSARELLGDHAIYLSPDDPSAWAETVIRLTDTPATAPKIAIPDWTSHFTIAERAFSDRMD